MPVVFACREGATLNNAGNCRTADREWRDIDLEPPEQTSNLTEAFLTDLVSTFQPEIMSLIVLALVVGITTGFAGGMILGVIRKGRNYRA